MMKKQLTRTLVLLILHICHHISTVTAGIWETNGTTPNIKEIIIGRCWQYQAIVKLNRLDSLTMDVNCTEVWEAFHNVVKFKDSCTLTKEDYMPVFDLMQRKKKLKDKTMFWSGTNELVHNVMCVTSDRYITLEDTLPGYIFDKLNWCGSLSSPDGIEYHDCSKAVKCKAYRPLWEAASEQFSKLAEGVAYVMINGTRKGGRPTYYKDSFFRSVEMPQINIDKLVVLVVSDIDEQPIERCGEGSLLTLDEDAKNRNATTECHHDPKFVLRILCAKYPEADQCREIVKQATSDGEWKPVGIVFLVVCVLLIAALLFLYAKHYGPCKTTHHLADYQSSSSADHNEMMNGDLNDNSATKLTKNCHNGQGWV